MNATASSVVHQFFVVRTLCVVVNLSLQFAVGPQSKGFCCAPSSGDCDANRRERNISSSLVCGVDPTTDLQIARDGEIEKR
jgi:hypothetical protein